MAGQRGLGAQQPRDELVAIDRAPQMRTDVGSDGGGVDAEHRQRDGGHQEAQLVVHPRHREGYQVTGQAHEHDGTLDDHDAVREEVGHHQRAQENERDGVQDGRVGRGKHGCEGGQEAGCDAAHEGGEGGPGRQEDGAHGGLPVGGTRAMDGMDGGACQRPIMISEHRLVVR